MQTTTSEDRRQLLQCSFFVDFALSRGGWCALFTQRCAELHHDVNAWLCDPKALNSTLARTENSSRRILEKTREWIYTEEAKLQSSPMSGVSWGLWVPAARPKSWKSWLLLGVQAEFPAARMVLGWGVLGSPRPCQGRCSPGRASEGAPIKSHLHSHTPSSNQGIPVPKGLPQAGAVVPR